MDPSIMKLLEDDEDESMHSGADVEAFTAALNRHIGGDAAAVSQPSSSDADAGTLSQGNSSVQWQVSSLEVNNSQENQRQEEQPHSLSMEHLKEGTGTESKDQQTVLHSEQSHSAAQQDQSHIVGQQQQAGTISGQLVESEQVELAEQNPVERIKQDGEQQSESQKQNGAQQSEGNGAQHSESAQHIIQELNSQQKQTPAADQADNPPRQTKAPPSIPFHMLIPMLRQNLDKDRCMQLQSVFGKLRSNEVSKEDFLRVIRGIVGDQMLRQAAHQVQMQLQAQAARNPRANPNQHAPGISSQQLSGRGPQPHVQTLVPTQNQNGYITKPPQSHVSVQTDASFQSVGSMSQMSRETLNKPESKGAHAVQISSTSMNLVNPEKDNPNTPQAANKQQQHLQLPQSSFSTYGSTVGNFHSHAYPRPSVNTAAPSLKTQTLDSQTRQPSLTQGMVSVKPGAGHSMNIMNVPKYELQSTASEAKRLHGGSLSHFTSHSTSLQNPVAWQPSSSKEQRSGSFPQMPFVKQEVVDQTAEPQNKSQLAALEGPSSGSILANKGNPTAGALKDDRSENQFPKVGFPPSTGTTASQISGAVTTPADSTMQMRALNSSATQPSIAGAVMKTPQKKPTIGQKKSIEALGSSPPPASKKQKTSGAFLDQSIEQLNDVTAVSGVNLREEEEQLLSGPKEESRASEATRRAVQEEEEKLILQKGPLQRKLADIISKCGIESVGSDVERCLSLLVEERLRGLISNVIRLSKQRVDTEKARHRVVFTSDVRRQILAVNQKAKEEWDKKQAEETEKLRKLNQTEGTAGSDAEKEKEENRSKNLKANKEEDDKMRTTAANVAARAAVGGDDMLSKWQLMAEQARQKREGLDTAPSSQTGKSAGRKSLSAFGRSMREQQEGGKKGSSSASGGARKLGRGPSASAHTRIERRITLKDLIAVLEREPQMAKSNLIYRLYERIPGDSVAE